MFGGVGFLLNGNMLVGVWKSSLIARLGPDPYDDALREPHVREFDITGKPMKGWVLIEPDGVDDDHQLAGWIERSMEFVQTLPNSKSMETVSRSCGTSRSPTKSVPTSRNTGPTP